MEPAPFRPKSAWTPALLATIRFWSTIFEQSGAQSPTAAPRFMPSSQTSAPSTRLSPHTTFAHVVPRHTRPAPHIVPLQAQPSVPTGHAPPSDFPPAPEAPPPPRPAAPPLALPPAPPVPAAPPLDVDPAAP